jgi:hypothetical protein
MMNHDLLGRTFPMTRPRILAETAQIGARRYRRRRDLPGAVPGLLAGGAEAILPRLVDEERRCEEARIGRSAAYRPALHVQILSALLAEAEASQAKASGSDALRSAI